MGHENLYTLCQLKMSATYLFPRPPSHQFSNLVLSKSLTTLPNHQPLLMNWHKYGPLGISHIILLTLVPHV